MQATKKRPAVTAIRTMIHNGKSTKIEDINYKRGLFLGTACHQEMFTTTL